MEEDIMMAEPSTSASASSENMEDLNHEFDDKNGEVHTLNFKNEGKPKVYQQQKALAHHILKRIKLSLKIQGRDLDQFTSIDIQVSFFFNQMG